MIKNEQELNSNKAGKGLTGLGKTTLHDCFESDYPSFFSAPSTAENSDQTAIEMEFFSQAVNSEP